MMPVHSNAAQPSGASRSAASKPERFMAQVAYSRKILDLKAGTLDMSTRPEAKVVPREILEMAMNRMKAGMRDPKPFELSFQGMAVAAPLEPGKGPETRQIKLIQATVEGRMEFYRVEHCQPRKHPDTGALLGFEVTAKDARDGRLIFDISDLTAMEAGGPRSAPEAAAGLPQAKKEGQGSRLSAPIGLVEPAEGTLRTPAPKPPAQAAAVPAVGAEVPEWMARPSHVQEGGERAPRRPVEKGKAPEAESQPRPEAGPGKSDRTERAYVADCPRPEAVNPRKYHSDQLSAAAERTWDAFYGLLRQGHHPAQAARHPDVGDANFQAVRGLPKGWFEIRLDGGKRAVFHVDYRGRASQFEVGVHIKD